MNGSAMLQEELHSIPMIASARVAEVTGAPIACPFTAHTSGFGKSRKRRNSPYIIHIFKYID